MRNSAVAIGLLFQISSYGQHILYDATRDKTAQDAATAAKGIASGALFDKMLRNVDAQGKQDVDTTMAFVEQQMRAELENFQFWNHKDDKVLELEHIGPGVDIIKDGTGECPSVICELESLQVQLQLALGPPIKKADIDARLREFETRKQLLQQLIANLKSKANAQDPVVIRVFEFLDENGQDAIDYATKIGKLTGNDGQAKALDAISDGLNEVLQLYKSVVDIWNGYKAIDVDPASLRPPREVLELQLVSLDEEHFQILTRIRARAQLEAGEALARVRTALFRLKAAGVSKSQEAVEKTLHDAAQAHDRERLQLLLRGLHEAAAAVAQMDASGRLANLRESDEERRYSIRRSSVNSSTYDLTIQAAAQRLALYWKSGVKPSDLAQLIFYLTNTVAVPVIATK